MELRTDGCLLTVAVTLTGSCTGVPQRRAHLVTHVLGFGLGVLRRVSGLPRSMLRRSVGEQGGREANGAAKRRASSRRGTRARTGLAGHGGFATCSASAGTIGVAVRPRVRPRHRRGPWWSRLLVRSATSRSGRHSWRQAPPGPGGCAVVRRRIGAKPRLGPIAGSPPTPGSPRSVAARAAAVRPPTPKDRTDRARSGNGRRCAASGRELRSPAPKGGLRRRP